jgi:hypothetical protein
MLKKSKMKKFLLLSMVLLAASPALFAQTGKAKTDTSTKQMYTCTMHPEVISDKPGKCPKCGMTLVEKKSGNKMDSSMHKMPMHKTDSSMHKMPM